MQACQEHIHDPLVLRLIDQYCHHLVDINANLVNIEKGISLGCPLSPLMGALYLKPLDDVMTTCQVHYTRYMDDWCILSNTRWYLKKAIRKMNAVLNDLKLIKHPDKTEMGRIGARPFTFLGYTYTKTTVSFRQQCVTEQVLTDFGVIFTERSTFM
jgi:hypothetical protein